MRKQLIIFVFVSIVFVSCLTKEPERDLIQHNETSSTQIDVNRQLRPVVLGEKRQNPYSLQNMTRALDSLKVMVTKSDETVLRSKQVDEIEIIPTDLYVRYLPKDTVQLNILLQDDKLILFDYPLDYEIEQYGDYYQDPTLKAPFVWYYTVVKPDYVPYQNIQYEVIEELFIPQNSTYFDEDAIDDTNLRKYNANNEDYNEVLTALHYLSHSLLADIDTNLDTHKRLTWDECKKGFLGIKTCTRWHRPEGYIRVNTPEGNEGVKGVKVRMARWFTLSETYTDENGYYISPEKFDQILISNDVVYTLQFSSEKNDNKWKLAEAYSTFISFGNTSFALGKAHPRGNDVTFNRTSEVWGRCILNNTIYEYCTFAENEGLSLPPKNLFVATSKSSEDYPYNSAPILGQILNREIQTIKALACMTVIGCITFFIQSPDIISTYPVYATAVWSKEAVQGDKAQDKRQYYNMKATTWHELIHTSQYERFKNERGFDAAKSYFIDYGGELIKNHLSGKNEGNAVYGKKGEKNWQSIAMSEGWADYNEWLLAQKHIQYNSLEQEMWNYKKTTPKDRYLEKYKEKDFPFNYSVMFYELHNVGCSIKDMEISLSTNTLAGFRDNLIAKYPSDKKETITQIIAKYE